MGIYRVSQSGDTHFLKILSSIPTEVRKMPKVFNRTVVISWKLQACPVKRFSLSWMHILEHFSAQTLQKEKNLNLCLKTDPTCCHMNINACYCFQLLEDFCKQVNDYQKLHTWKKQKKQKSNMKLSDWPWQCSFWNYMLM